MNNTKNTENFLSRLKDGVYMNELTSSEIELVAELQEDGEFIVLASDDKLIARQIEQSCPFCFELKTNDLGEPFVEIQPDGAAPADFVELRGEVFMTLG